MILQHFELFLYMQSFRLQINSGRFQVSPVYWQFMVIICRFQVNQGKSVHLKAISGQFQVIFRGLQVIYGRYSLIRQFISGNFWLISLGISVGNFLQPVVQKLWNINQLARINLN